MRSHSFATVLPMGLASVLLLASAPGCSSGPACAVDTDCPLGNRCAADGTCQRVGVVQDGGPPSTDAGPRDGATSDARTDGGDGGGASDAGGDAPASCPATDGVYPLTTVGIMCTGLTATTMTLTSADGMFCTFSVLFDATDAGVLTSTGAVRMDDLRGTLNIGGTPTVCTATFSATAGTVDVSCESGCTFTATRPAP